MVFCSLVHNPHLSTCSLETWSFPPANRTLRMWQIHITHCLRKPVAEQMLRDCINCCIEQLRSLLTPEFNQQFNSKLEKADVLEMTVTVSKIRCQQNQPVVFISSSPINQGFSRHIHDIHFLSKDKNHFQNLQPSDENKMEHNFPQQNCTDKYTISKKENSAKSTLWRPW
uniref:BHLH domain-containing protein n=1 Tax=Electrophorus electricus TaxID=8005 RepID=A0A4W4FRY4_ELEEL